MRLLTLALIGLLMVACGQDPALQAPAEGSAGQPQADEETADVLEGTLGGDAQLEGGCAWLDARERYEVLYPEGYRIEFAPLRLLGPDGATIAEEGDTVRVRGRIAEDLMSACQVGTLYEASEVVTDS